MPIKHTVPAGNKPAMWSVKMSSRTNVLVDGIPNNCFSGRTIPMFNQTISRFASLCAGQKQPLLSFVLSAFIYPIPLR